MVYALPYRPIKFKEFDVGDADYEEQIEQFQAEHQNAEFVQITGGHMSYEKIWFKYEPSDNFSTTDNLSVEKLQEQLNTAKKALTEIAGGHTVEDAIFNHQLIASEALAAIGGDR